MALKNFTQFSPQIVLSATDFLVGYRNLDEIRTDLDSMSLGVSALLISKGFLPGTTLGSIKRKSFQYTIVPGNNLNAVSGTDDYGNILSYTVNQVEVYRNGSHLVNSQDYLANNSTQILNLSTLNFGDIVQVVGLSGIGVTQQNTLSGFLGNLVQTNFRYSVASSNTITPGSTVISGSDDYGAVLSFKTNAFEVYLNGSHLVRDYDYTSYNLGTSFTLASPVSNGDSVNVVSLSSVTTSQLSSISAFSGISKILAGDRTAISSSTGNVTVSSQTCISDILVPSWTNANHISQFSLLQDYLSAVAASNTSAASAVYISYFGASTYGGGSSQVTAQGILGPNGKIYCMSGDTDQPVLVINPDDLTISSIAPIGGTLNRRENATGSLAPNGKIYEVPGGMFAGVINNTFRFIDPSTGTRSVFATVPAVNPGVDTPLSNSVVAPDGKIHMIASEISLNFVVDPYSNAISSYVLNSVPPRVRGILAPNGKIYCLPTTYSTIFIVDPSNNAVSSISTFVQGGNGIDNLSQISCLAPNGNIYFGLGEGSKRLYVLDPSNNSVTSFGTFADSYGSSTLCPNGKIYCLPTASVNTTSLLCIDPQTNTTTEIGGFTFVATLYSGIFASNSKQTRLIINNSGYFNTPSNAHICVDIPTNNNWNMNVSTNPLFNNQD